MNVHFRSLLSKGISYLRLLFWVMKSAGMIFRFEFSGMLRYVCYDLLAVLIRASHFRRNNLLISCIRLGQIVVLKLALRLHYTNAELSWSGLICN